MEAVRTVTGRALPLDRADVDTDQIIPAVWLKRIERTGFAQGLFSAWREDPAFVLNQPRFAGATILLAGPNFGCGSSREHAAWALHDYGFRAVASPRFADIFRNNCLKIGLVVAELRQQDVTTLMRAVEADPSIEITVDVERRRVSAPEAGVKVAFPLDDFTRWRLLNGLDDISLSMRHEDAITEYEGGRPSWLPALGGVD